PMRAGTRRGSFRDWRRGIVDVQDRHAARIAVGGRITPAPDPQTERQRAFDAVRADVASADAFRRPVRVRIWAIDPHTRPLVVNAKRLPVAERTGAVELHVREHTVFSPAHHDDVRIRDRRISEKYVTRQVLLRWDRQDDVRSADINRTSIPSRT